MINDEARKKNNELPGMGGVFNNINLHLYHYAGNNPVKYTEPTGGFFQEAVIILDSISNDPATIGLLITLPEPVTTIIGVVALLYKLGKDIQAKIDETESNINYAKGKTKDKNNPKEGEKNQQSDEERKAENKAKLKDMKDNPPDHPDYKPPKNWDGKKKKGG